MAQSYEEFSDKELVELVLDGNKYLYGELFNRYKDLVYRHCLMIIGDNDMALDALQESFLTGYKSLDRLRNPEKFAFWIAGIAKNICLNLKRKFDSRMISLDSIVDKGIEPSSSGDDSLFDPELIQKVRKIMATLPKAHREIIELFYVKNISTKQIANFLGISLSAVKSRLFHSRKIILKLLKKDGAI